MVLRIAVTGATGFVGKALLPLLLAKDHKIKVLIRKAQGNPIPEHVETAQGDLADAVALRRLTLHADVVLHIAGVVTGVDATDFMTANVDGTQAVATAALANGVKHFVYVSSLAARDASLNAYAASKFAAERLLQNMPGDMALTILRPAAIYGPGDLATLPLLRTLMSRVALIPGRDDARFAMVHVSDVARVLVEAIEAPAPGVYDVDDGAGGHDWAELIGLTRKHFAFPQNVVFIPRTLALMLGFAGDGVARLRRRPSLVNSGQIRQIYHPDWQVQGQSWPLTNPVPLQDGLPQVIRWYQAHGMLPVRTATDRRPSDSGATS